MSKSIITLITVLTLVVLHGVHYFFGLSGIMYALGAVVVFFGFARMLYWRQLRKLRQSTRSLPPEYRVALYDVCGLDAEARKDMEKLDRENQSRR
jgi:hypothetical protein